MGKLRLQSGWANGVGAVFVALSCVPFGPVVGAEFAVQPPANLERLMEASEAERLHHIRLGKNTIRQALNRGSASLAQATSIVEASDTTGSVVAAAKAAGIRLNVKDFGTLQQAEETLQWFRDQVFVRPVLREFIPNRIGMIHGATVLRIYDDAWAQTLSHMEKPFPDAWRRLLVEMPDKTRIMIKSFPAELVAEGKPLANPGTIYTTTGYTKYRESEEEETALVAEILFVPNLHAYLEELKQVRDALKDPAVRRWKDKDGEELLIGKFVNFTRAKVNIKKPDGSIERVSMTELALGDQQYIRSTLEDRRQSAKTRD